MDNAFRRQFAAQLAAIRTLSPVDLLSTSERWTRTIENIGVNGFISFQGKTYQTVEIGEYRETSDNHEKILDSSWQELKLFCIETGKTVYLEWEKDDDIIIYVTIEELEFSEISDEEGDEIDEDDLDQITEDEDSLFYQGEEFEYEDDCAAIYLRNKNAQGEKLWLYDFEDKSGNCITIEEWMTDGKEEYKLFLSTKLSPNAIEVISIGG